MRARIQKIFLDCGSEENIVDSGEEFVPADFEVDSRDSKRTRHKNERGDRKKESNDSPEIPDRGMGHPTSLTSLWEAKTKQKHAPKQQQCFSFS